MQIVVKHDISQISTQLEDVLDKLIWLKGYILSRNISNGLQV